MRWFRSRSFEARLGLLVAVAVGFVVVLAAVASYVLVAHQTYSQVDSKLQQFFGRVEPNAPDGGAPGSQGPGIGQRIGMINQAIQAARSDGNVVELITASGQVVADNNSAIRPTGRQRARSADASRVLFSNVTSGSTTYRARTAGLGFDVRVTPNGVVSCSSAQTSACSPAALIVAQPVNTLLNALATLRLILYLVVIAGIAVAVALGVLIAKATIRPVKRLTAAAEHVAATQDLGAVIDEEGDDELARLAHAFNEMLTALGASRRQQAQLVSDAGHELRTPLTSLRTNVELLMRARTLPEADRSELYGDISGQIEELTTLIGDLVELARHEEQQPEPIEVRYDDIVERGVARAARRAPSVRFDVRLTPGSVRATPALLERAVLNLLDNAAKWSPPGGTVDVGLTRGDRWVLTVRDDGPGIADDDLPRVFDRFYRAPAARSMPGSGLGLAIVDQVVRSHGGSVTVSRPDGGGTLVRVELPIVSEQEPAPPGMPPPPSVPMPPPPSVPMPPPPSVPMPPPPSVPMPPPPSVPPPSAPPQAVPLPGAAPGASPGERTFAGGGAAPDRRA